MEHGVKSETIFFCTGSDMDLLIERLETLRLRFFGISREP